MTTATDSVTESRAIQMIQDTDVPGGITHGRVDKLVDVMRSLNWRDGLKLRLEVCGDEKTGTRYGRAKCRVGKCAKIGSGGRNRHSAVNAYQIWAVWA